ncbi:MAG: ABC transporter permease [Geminicoccaceae bacterium]|nr:ABC transporter permease [Geminicoccaceae bacterium]
MNTTPALVLRRLIGLATTLLLAAFVVFAVLSVLPGDPAAVMLGVGARPDTLAALRAEMGLDRPVAVRFVSWTGGLFVGDFGVSHTYGVPVLDLVLERAAVSLPLALLAAGGAVFVGVPLGALAASQRGGVLDTVLMALAQVGIAVPSFWLAIMLSLVFAVGLDWLPAGGFPGWEAGVWPGLRALFLPALALALPQGAVLARVARSAVLEALHQDYVLTARMKGLSKGAALWRHALPNALIPVATVLGLQLAFLLTGAIVVENVFYLPGVGRLLFQAIAQRDLITVQGIVVLVVTAVVCINFVVDLTYLWLDPRLRTRGA